MTDFADTAPPSKIDSNGPSDPDHRSLDLPAYTPHSQTASISASTKAYPPSEGTEHTFDLVNDEGRPWLTLTIHSHAYSRKSLPVFLEGERIIGRIDANLDKLDSIHAVIINVKGLFVFSGIDSKQFLDFSEILWDTSMGDPRNPAPGQGKHSDKLIGQFRWPVSIEMPKHIDDLSANVAKDLGVSTNQPLPPSFSGKGGYSTIRYELTVTVKRTGIFRINSILTTPFGYTPRSRPVPPSQLRQTAYQDNVPLLGPELDPSGWKVFSPIDVHGTLFDAREVYVRCSLALATPLSYTRGSVIPCILTFESNDSQALDLLTNPKAPIVHLLHKVHLKPGVDNVGVGLVDSARDKNMPIGTAYWWHPDESTTGDKKADVDGPDKRTLNGEIHIPLNNVPSFTFGEFSLKYRVEMLPFNAVGFVPSSENRLYRTDVEITTDYAVGPKPRAYLPPQYHSSHIPTS